MQHLLVRGFQFLFQQVYRAELALFSIEFQGGVRCDAFHFHEAQNNPVAAFGFFQGGYDHVLGGDTTEGMGWWQRLGLEFIGAGDGNEGRAEGHAGAVGFRGFPIAFA